jgi:hypothetical protein
MNKVVYVSDNNDQNQTQSSQSLYKEGGIDNHPLKSNMPKKNMNTLDSQDVPDVPGANTNKVHMDGLKEPHSTLNQQLDNERKEPQYNDLNSENNLHGENNLNNLEGGGGKSTSEHSLSDTDDGSSVYSSDGDVSNNSNIQEDAASVSSLDTEDLLRVDPLYYRLTRFLQTGGVNVAEILFGIKEEMVMLNKNISNMYALTQQQKK